MTRHAVLSHENHRDLRIRVDSAAKLGDATMTAFTVPSEFRRIQHAFPIVFRRDAASGRFSALALLGFETGENLFLEDDRWTADYKPMSLAIQPFLVGRPDQNGPAHVHIDLDHPRISTNGEGVLLFEESGQPTPYLERVSIMLDELDQGHRSSGDFFGALERYELLEPFSLDVELRDGSKHRLVGYHLIDEEKLRTLEPGAVAELHAQGHLMPIFMVLASLSNISTMVDLKNRRMGHG